MKLTMILTAACLILSACGSGGSDSSSPSAQSTTTQPGQTQSPPPTPQAQPPAPAPDYSKISCGSVSDCSKACDVTFPTISNDDIRVNICGIPAGTTTSATCNALTTQNNTETGYNTTCKTWMTTVLIETTDIGSAACGSVSSCKTICGLLYQPTTDQIIIGSTSGGARLQGLTLNHWLVAQLNACLVAPSSFVIRSALPN